MATQELPKTMKGLQIVEWNKPYVFKTDIPVPKIRDNEILIKIAVAGYCHTETMVLRGDFVSMAPSDPLPQIPSHEPTGWVVAIGSAVPKDLFKIGQRVGNLNMQHPCGACMDCKMGKKKYCSKLGGMAGVTVDGAFAEYMVADPDFTVPLPDELPFEAAAPLFCAGATIYTGLKTCGLTAGQTVAIIGAGALGHLGVQFAKCQGLNVVCVDSRDAPLEMVQTLKYKPDIVINATQGVEAALKKIPWPVDATLVATDAIPAYEFALDLTRKHGTMVVVGQPTEPIPVHYRYLIFRNITIKGSLLGNVEDTREMVKLVAEKGIEVRTKAYKLEEIEKLIEDTHKKEMSGKMVVKVAEQP